MKSSSAVNHATQVCKINLSGSGMGFSRDRNGDSRWKSQKQETLKYLELLFLLAYISNEGPP